MKNGRTLWTLAALATGALVCADAVYAHGSARISSTSRISTSAGSSSTGSSATGGANTGGRTGGRPTGGSTGGRGIGGGTTGGRDMVAAEGEYGFVPGQTGQLSWNTTREVDGKPIFLYVYNCENRDGSNFDFSRVLERELLKDEKVVEMARSFVCEKTCHDGPNFLEKIPHREMMEDYITALSKQKKIDSHIAILDANGKVISTVFGTKQLKRLGVKGLSKMLRKAQSENEKRVAIP